MAVNFTLDQQKAISAHGTVLVSAAAGSGKTAVLTERVVKAICDPSQNISADRLLVVTFTNASALEMRVRIAKRLDEECLLHPENTYILKQKLLLSGAKICTIDAFCIDLLKRYFAIVGISPDFKIADESYLRALKEKCLKKVLSRKYAEKNEALDALADAFMLEKNENQLIDAVLKVYETAMCMPRYNDWLKTAAESYNCNSLQNCGFSDVLINSVYNTVVMQIDQIELLLREIEGTEFEPTHLVAFSDTREELLNIKHLAEDKDWDGVYNAVLNFKRPQSKSIRNPNDVRLAEVIKAARNDIFSSITKLVDRMTGTEAEVISALNSAYPMVKLFSLIVAEFAENLHQSLCGDNKLTFSLIEQLALGLLCDEKDGRLSPSEISKEICKNYDMVMVDEYQDNNDLQDALFFALSDNGKKLFTVGDVKQCIYGFRGANPDNFLGYKNSYPLYDGVTSPSKIILKQNFRSRKGVCDFVNAFCSVVMSLESCGMDYTDEDELVASAEYAKENSPAVNLLVNDISESDLKRPEADAKAVADYIENTMKQPPFLKSKDGGLRAADYGDFAILLRSPGPRADYYTSELKSRGIPVSYESGEFYDTPEISIIMSLLRVIDNPARDIPLLAIMTSVVFGFTPDELAKIKVTYEGKSLYAKVCNAAAEGDAHCSELIKTLSQYRRAAATMSVGKLINEIYLKTALPEIMSAFSYGERRKQNLRRLSNLANEYDGDLGGLQGFLSAFEHMENIRSDKIPASNTGAVRIMSFHGSKGLQFPICIIADCGGAFNKRDSIESFVVNYELGMGLKYVDQKDGVKKTTIAREAIATMQDKRSKAEEIRLLYVAMTRAEERLVLSVTSKNPEKLIVDAAESLGLSQPTCRPSAGEVLSANGFYKWIYMTALLQNDGKKLGEYASVVPPLGGNAGFLLSVTKFLGDESDNTKAQTENEMPQITPEFLSKVQACRQQLENRLNAEYEFEEECLVPSKVAVTELVHGSDKQYSFKARPRFMSKAGLTPAERGTAAHKFMQYASYENAEVDVKAELERLREWEFLSDEEAEAIDADKMASFFGSDVYYRIKNAKQVWREYKFMVEYPTQNSVTIAQGIADCVFLEQDGLVILDFKTDAVNDVSLLVDSYAEQLKVYKYALEKIFETQVKECVLYSLNLGKQISI